MPAQEIKIKEIQKILDFASALGDSILSMTVNCTNTYGDTPLICASVNPARQSGLAVSRLLLEHKASVDQANTKNVSTCMHI
jgi:ankyrin repeat protein